MDDEKVKEYTNGEITIVWKPDKCIHSAVCAKSLPEVFQPKSKPWVNMDNSDTEKIMEVVNNCPSGALRYYSNNENKTTKMDSNKSINVITNGPLIVEGPLEIEYKEGKITTKAGDKTAFCRCGASSNKPYCDGAHRKLNFED